MIELLIITAVVYGCKKAWDDATGAASRALGGFYQNAQRKLGTRYGGSPRLHKALTGTATAAYGTVLAPKAFLADWRANWRSNWQAGKDRAEVRWGRPLIPQSENENGSENVSSRSNENYTETFDRNIDAAVSHFKGENRARENEKGVTHELTERERLENEAYKWFLADPRISDDDRLSVLAARRQPHWGRSAREAVVSLYQEARRGQTRLQAEGQGVSHTYVTETPAEVPEKVPTLEDLKGAVAALNHQEVTDLLGLDQLIQSTKKPAAQDPPSTPKGSNDVTEPTVNETLNLEALGILAQDLNGHANAELDNAAGSYNAYTELAAKLESNAGALKSLQAEGSAAHVQGGQEALAAAAAAQQNVQAAMDTYRAHTAALVDGVQRHRVAAEARNQLPEGDKNVAASFHNVAPTAAPADSSSA